MDAVPTTGVAAERLPLNTASAAGPYAGDEEPRGGGRPGVTATVSTPSGLKLGPVDLSREQAAAVGAAFILVAGLGLGFAVPPPSKDPAPWDRVSSVIGWWYFTAWAVSFLPQLYMNWRRQCVVGQSFEYVFLNVLGFACYSIYTICFYFVGSIRDEYHKRFHADDNVQINDVGFAVYAFLLCLVNTWQIYRYDRGPQKMPKIALGVIAAVVSVFIVWGVLLLCGVRAEYFFNPLDMLYGLSIVKLGVTLVKYVPQVYLNFRRKLTVGWNIWNVLLDFAGGSLSVTQELIDSGTTGDWSGIAGNPIKFCLGSMSMIYDCIFMFQHFVLYRKNNAAFVAAEAAERCQDDEQDADDDDLQDPKAVV